MDCRVRTIQMLLWWFGFSCWGFCVVKPLVRDCDLFQLSTTLSCVFKAEFGFFRAQRKHTQPLCHYLFEHPVSVYMCVCVCVCVRTKLFIPLCLLKNTILSVISE